MVKRSRCSMNRDHPHRHTAAVGAAAVVLSLGLPPVGLSLAARGAAAGDVAAREVAEGWSVPVVVSRGANLYDAMVAAAPEGDVTVMWTREQRGVFSRTRQAGGSWGPVLRVSRSGWLEDVGVDRTGTVTAVWVRPMSGQRRVVMTSSRPDAGAWTAPRRISSIPSSRGTYTHHDGVELDVSPSGAAAAVWTLGSEHGGPDYRALANYRPAGGRWGKQVRLADPPSSAGDVEISPGGAPLVLVAGSDVRSGGRFIIRRSSEESVLAIGAGGHRVVVERHYEKDRSFVVGRRLVRGDWTRRVRLDSGGEAYGFALGVDADGVATVAWMDDVGRRIQVVRWPPGERPWRPRTVGRGGRFGGAPALAVAGNGASTVVWTPLSGRAGTRLLASTRPPSGPWSEPEVVSRRRAVGHFEEGIDMWPDGRAAVTWPSEDHRRVLLSWNRWDRH